MKFSSTLVVAALSVALNAYELDRRNLDSGVSWTGEIVPGKTVTYTGTIQEVQEQIAAISPDYFEERSNAAGEIPGSNVEKRWYQKGAPYCEYGEWMQRTSAIEGINYLNGNLGGNMMCGAPPRTATGGGCSRISCSWSSEIWLCNDQDVEIRLPCSEVASAALELSNVCYWVQQGGMTMTRGQLFTTANWNVILTKGSC